MRALTHALLTLAVLSVALLVAGPASAMACLESPERAGVTVVVDRGSGEPEAACVPEGAGRPAAEVLDDAEVPTAYQDPHWSFWSSTGDGRWRLEPAGPAEVTVPDGGFLGWALRTEPGDPAPPRTAPRPLTEAERMVATRPPGMEEAGGDALGDVLKGVGAIAVVLLLLVGAVTLQQRRQDRSD